MKLEFTLLVILFIFSFNQCNAHNPDNLSGVLPGIRVFGNYENIGLNPDINAYWGFLNGGISADLQKTQKPDYKIFLGLGVVNIIQFQYGTNFSENILRIRSDLYIFDSIFFFTNYKKRKLSRINLQIYYERKYGNGGINHWGIGLGYKI